MRTHQYIDSFSHQPVIRQYYLVWPWGPTIPCHIAGLLAVCALLLVPVRASAAAEYATGPEPAWAKPLTLSVPTSVEHATLSQGTYYLLTDSQTWVKNDTVIKYRHYAQQAVNQAGLDSISRVSINFDPTYEKITLHRLRIIRKGKVTDILARAKIMVLQREKDAESRIYDGSKTINMVLEDIRVGDVVEYSYTRQGENPVLANHYYDNYHLGWAVPVREVYFRLLWPTQRPLFIKPHGTTNTPKIKAAGATTEYVWSVKDAKAITEDANLPGWYDPYPWIQVSEMDTWEGVIRWALPLYTVTAPIGPDVSAAIKEISARTESKEDQLLSVLRFVQNEIRYLGIEIGAGSYAPNMPDTVLARRFGDCKDKSLLMVTMLRALGIDARPALVHTYLRKQLVDWQPTPAAFNHIVVFVKLNGKSYWLDPTRNYQKGTLENVAQSNYGLALVVDETTRGLSTMEATRPVYNQKQVSEVFDLRTAEQEPGDFTVSTHFERYYADDIRYTLATNIHDAIEKSYLEYYGRYYPDIKPNGGFQIKDDASANRMTITERYAIPNIWKANTGESEEKIEFYPNLILGHVSRIPNVSRTMPLFIAHPVSLRHVTSVLLPHDFSVTEGVVSVSDPVFSFSRKIAYREKKLILEYEFESKRDHVAADEMGRYVDNLNKVDALLGYQVSRPTVGTQASAPAVSPPPSKPKHSINWSTLLIAIFSGVIWLLVARKIYRYDPPTWAQRHGKGVNNDLNGIGGWLILPAIGIIVQPFVIGASLYQSSSSYSASTWQNLTGNDAVSPYLIPWLLFELVGNIGLLVVSIGLLVLFVRKRTSVPMVYLGYSVFTVIFLGLDLIVASLIQIEDAAPSTRENAELLRAMVVTVLWGSYFMLSERVKATFVHRRVRASDSSANDARLAGKSAALTEEGAA